MNLTVSDPSEDSLLEQRGAGTKNHHGTEWAVLFWLCAQNCGNTVDGAGNSLPEHQERQNKRWPKNWLDASADITGMGGEKSGRWGEEQCRRCTSGCENVGFYSEIRCNRGGWAFEDQSGSTVGVSPERKGSGGRENSP